MNSKDCYTLIYWHPQSVIPVAQKKRKDTECVAACWSGCLCSNCLLLKIVWKILSRSAMETGLDRRHSYIISSPHTPSNICSHSSFPLLSHRTPVTSAASPPIFRQIKCRLLCFGLASFLRCYMLHDGFSGVSRATFFAIVEERGLTSVDRNRKEWRRLVFEGEKNTLRNVSFRNVYLSMKHTTLCWNETSWDIIYLIILHKLIPIYQKHIKVSCVCRDDSNYRLNDGITGPLILNKHIYRPVWPLSVLYHWKRIKSCTHMGSCLFSHLGTFEMVKVGCKS